MKEEINNDVKKKNKKDKSTVIDVKFEDLEGKLLLVKVGNGDSGQLSEHQLDVWQKKLSKEIEKKGVNCIVVVAPHDVTMEIIEKQNRYG